MRSPSPPSNLPTPGWPGRRVVAELVRLPAVLTVPGDALLGAAAAGAPLGPAALAGRAAAAGCLYLGGMALNDYADRAVDAVERPGRPIPSGRVDPAFALRLAQALTAGGLALAGLTGGRRALRVAVPLAGAVWAYDLGLKRTAAGPAAMAACRALDVLLGASPGRTRDALVPAAVVAAHTLTVTQVSRHEAEGGTPAVARRAVAGTAAVTGLAAVWPVARRRRPLLPFSGHVSTSAVATCPELRRPARPLPFWRELTTATVAKSLQNGGRGPAAGRAGRTVAVSGALLAAYAGPLGRAAGRAARDPGPARLQQLVGTGVLGLMPLQGALLAGLGRTPTAAALGAVWPLARHRARRRNVT